MAVSFKEFAQNVRNDVLGEFNIAQVAEWIQKHTTINGRPISFKGREYQLRILESDAPTIVVKKCSQVGLSELMIRRALALCDIIPGFKIIHTLPTTQFAQKVSKTRVDPIIESSPRLSSKVSRQVDSASVKRFGDSYLYISGTFSVNETISVPADALSIDELDFSDQNNVSNLQSRLTASKYRWWSYISTPTIPNFGIDAQFQATRQYYNWCKCEHCGHWYIPNFLQHTRVPDFDGDLLSIRKNQLGSIRWKEATLHCPRCEKPANLLPEHRRWVCKNPDANFDGEGFQVNPLDAPTIITPANLIEWSTRFHRKIDFVNYHLGEVMEDSSSGFGSDDLDRMERIGQQPLHGFKVFGLDMGVECHLCVGVTDGQGRLNVIDKRRLDYRTLESQLSQLIQIYRPKVILADSQPYVETIHRLQSTIQNLFGSVYITTKEIVPFKVVDKEEDLQKSLLGRRQVNVNRNVALNVLMDEIRLGKIGVKVDSEQPRFREHMLDMKRQASNAKAFNGELSSGDTQEAESYVWVKTKGNDHYHHALLYCHIASQMVHHVPDHGTLPIFVSSFRVKS